MARSQSPQPFFLIFYFYPHRYYSRRARNLACSGKIPALRPTGASILLKTVICYPSAVTGFVAHELVIFCIAGTLNHSETIIDWRSKYSKGKFCQVFREMKMEQLLKAKQLRERGFGRGAGADAGAVAEADADASADRRGLRKKIYVDLLDRNFAMEI